MSEYANYDDYNDLNEESEYDPKPSKTGKIIKKTLLYTLRIASFFVIALLFWRIFSGGDPKSMQKFLWTEETIESYQNDPDSFKAYYYRHKDNLTTDGKFAASYVYYVPSEKQIQITLRYNDSTLEKLMRDYSLSDVPTEEPFVFVLTDGSGKNYTEYKYVSDTKNMYNYRRLVFDGIDFEPLIVDELPYNATEDEVKEFKNNTKDKYIHLKVYYKDDVLLSEPYGIMSVFDYSYSREELDLKKFKPELTSGLTPRMDYTVKEEPDETDEQ